MVALSTFFGATIYLYSDDIERMFFANYIYAAVALRELRVKTVSAIWGEKEKIVSGVIIFHGFPMHSCIYTTYLEKSYYVRCVNLI